MIKNVTEFSERLGLLAEEDGMPRIAGRMVGYLMLQESACSLDDLASHLQVSKASISTNARMLEDRGVLSRTSSPGDRRDFYEITQRHWENFIRTAQRKVQRLQSLVEDTLASTPAGQKVARRRLREAALFYQFLLTQLAHIEVEWRHVYAEAVKNKSLDEPGTPGKSRSHLSKPRHR